MPTNRHITLDDIHLAQSPHGLLALFGRLGYAVEADAIALDKHEIGFAPADAAAIKRLFLLADEGGQVQIVLFELEEAALTRIRSLAGNLLSRGGNYLVVATQDYRRVVFANPRRETGGVKIRKLVVDTSHPTRHDLDVLEGLAVTVKHPDAIYQTQCAAFDVEKVTSRFYEEYAKLFRRVETALRDNNKGVRPFYEAQELHAFTQRLLGRVMFLFFIQKKGWLAGDARFLVNQFKQAAGEQRNYYATVLEPLFFEMLNKRRANNDSPWGKIPYLNGGLFEKDYDFLLYLPNDLFDPSAQGVLEFFHNYNFTIAEDTPAEQEVAVDPEMLGKVFENMMEERERGKSGTFYTPRPIVHYMCREALLGFLTERTALPRSLLAVQFDETPAEGLSLPEAHAVESALDALRVLDPAVGTGAFLVGILHELVSLRLACETAKGAQVPRSSAKAAEWKRQFISNALYGVDIKSEAIEIAKLRLWLSLVVDLELRYVEPLPNLDYKLRVGNSLLETVEGEPILVGDETGAGLNPLPRSNKGGQYGLGMDSNIHARAGLVELKQKFFAAQTPEERAEYRGQIEARERAMMLKALDEKITNLDVRLAQITKKGSLVNWRGLAREQKELEVLALRKARIVERRAEVNAGKPLPFFLYRLHFFEVFRDNGGFDIAIANPPYVRQELISDQKIDLKAAFPQVYDGVADLYVYFYARGLDLLREGGMLSFISSNKFMRAGYGANLRKLLSQSTSLERVIDIGDLPVFEAIAYPCIIITRKAKPTEGHAPLVMNITDLDVALHLEQEAPKLAWAMPQSDFRVEGWTIENTAILNLLKKLKSSGSSLGEYVQNHIFMGLKTGLNEAFVIDELTRQNLISLDPSSNKVIKKWLRGRDIKHWATDWADQYIIFIQNSGDQDANNLWGKAKTEKEAVEMFANTFPAIYNYLLPHEKSLRTRQDQGRFWWEMRPCAYIAEFSKPKIVYQEIATYQTFTYVDEPFLVNNKCFFIPTDDLYLLGILNSKVGWFLLGKMVAKLQGGAYTLQSTYISQIPIPSASAEERAAIAGLARRLLDLRGAGGEVAVLEGELNQRVYGLFGLSDDEVKMIENG